MTILVTGTNGQLGNCIKAVSKTIKEIHFVFKTAQELDITKAAQLRIFFSENTFQYCINCAAYTNVEQAEKEPEKAFAVNAEGVKNLAIACNIHHTTLIHMSTDYVFDGKKNIPYTEEDIPNPINVYGKSKLAGERYIQEQLDHYFIVRTSWLYSQYGKNFYTTMVRLFETKDTVTVTTAEIGTPTNANNVADFLLFLIQNRSRAYGIYHYSNLGEATWYDFASAILEQSGKQGQIRLEKTDNYPTFAKRPEYSVLSKEKCISVFVNSFLDWKASLKIIAQKS